MSGRYAFSVPEPRQRDGWFRIGKVDVTTTALITGLGLFSMVLYALSPLTAYYGAFQTELVRQGQVWRVGTWPLVNPPTSVWMLVSLWFFWYFGHQVEDQIGRKPYTWLVAAMVVIPAVFVSLLNVTNDAFGRWAASTYSVQLLGVGMLCIFALDRPNAQFMFGIPAWVVAAAIAFIEVMQDVGNRRWAQLILVTLVVLIGLLGAAQRGMIDEFAWIPRWKRLAGPAPSPYGEMGSARPTAKKKRFGKGKTAAPATGNTVVSGPWGNQIVGGPTPLEQAELDVLLDRISEGGIDSLTPFEKERLNELSKRMRGS